jgi:hypothetical protein
VLNPNLNGAEVERLNAQLGAILSGDSSVISAMEEQATDELLDGASSAHGEQTLATDLTVIDAVDAAGSSESDASGSCAESGAGVDDQEETHATE